MDGIQRLNCSMRKKKSLVLESTSKLALRILTQADVNLRYLSWLKDYEVTKYTEQSDKKQSLTKIESYVVEKLVSPNDFLFGIFFCGEHVGNIKIGPIKWEHLCCDVSYFIGDRNLWGRGVATESIQLAIKFAFNDLKLEKIRAGYYSTNIASGAVLSKCGFIVEGVLREAVIFEGRRIDAIEVGLLKRDFV